APAATSLASACWRMAVAKSSPVLNSVTTLPAEPKAGSSVPLRMQRIQAFFQSDYFANVPEVRIGSELFALLRYRLRQGEYRNKDKNRNRFDGLFYDIRFISTYAPYCDAMVVDYFMVQWAT